MSARDASAETPGRQQREEDSVVGATLPLTEAAHPDSRGIDAKGTREILEIMHAADETAWSAVGAASAAIAAVVDRVVEAFRSGARLIYIGAGTSGRLGVLDASECPPTFGVDPKLVVGVMAGGDDALRRAVEGAEDDEAAGSDAVASLEVGPNDVVCGIAASGTTAFVWGALHEARLRGAATALVHAQREFPAGRSRSAVDYEVALVTGPEIIAGSTRLKAGTATKLALNRITTAAMIRWGKVYDNLMVDVRVSNRKLERRARRLVEQIGCVDAERAAELLEASGRDVKTAIVMARHSVDRKAAAELLTLQGGALRAVLETGPGETSDREASDSRTDAPSTEP